MGYNSKYTGAQVESLLDAIPNKADKSTTLSGYGIADGVNAVLSSGSGNVLTALSINGHTLTYTKGITALTSHQTIYGLTIKGNGTALATYTPNSAALSIDITPSNIGAAAASHTHSQYLTAHQSVVLASGTNNGTLKLTTAAGTTDNIAVKGLGSAAFTAASAYAAASHTHSYLPLSGGTVTGPIEIKSSVNNNYNEGLRITRAGNSWAGITFGSTGISGAPSNGWFAATNPNNQFIITPDDSSSTTGLTLNKSGDALWCNNTILHSSNYNSYAPTLSGTGASGTWGISVTGSSASCTGNAATASKLATARTITLTGSVTGSVSFDGSGNVSLATSTNHTHSQYLTAHQSIYALSIIAGTTTVSTYTPNSAANSITFAAGSNISLSADATNKKITIANTYSYSHPTGGANTTISAANGKVLSAITVNSLGHVTSVSSKTLAVADIPSLDWSKIKSGKPTTLAGYGISDAYTKAQVDAAIQSAISTYITNALNTSV